MATTLEFLRSVLCELANIAAETAAYGNWLDDFSRKEIREVWLDEKGPLRKSRGRRVDIQELQLLSRDELYSMGFRNWDGHLILIPLWAYNYLAEGSELEDICGDNVVKGKDQVDFDIRGGAMAYGFRMVGGKE